MIRKTGCLAIAAAISLWTMASAQVQSTAEWHYAVKPGDNPWSLTNRLLDGMKYWPRVQQHNGITNPLNIAPGTILRIPVAWLRTESGTARVLATSQGGCLLRVDTGAGTAALEGDRLRAGTVVHSTTGGRCTLQFPDQSRILLHEDSELRLERMLSYAMTGMHDIATRLLRGRAETQVTPATGPASRFEIHSPQGVTSVRGTRYRIASQDDGARAEVLEGGVDVRNGMGQVMLAAGMGTVFTHSNAPAEPMHLLDAPRVTGLPATARASQAALPFPAVEGAQAYRQQFAAGIGFELPLADQRVERAALMVPALAEGDYHFRVRAIDRLGLEGHDASGMLHIEHLLPAPSGCSAGDGARVRTRHVSATCTQVAAARWYRVQLARDHSFAAPQIDLLSGTPTSELALDGPGQFFWRMAAIDSAGREGAFTPPMALRRVLDPPVLEVLALSRSSLSLAWKPRLAGHRYRLQLATDRDFSALIEDHTTLGDRLVVPRPKAGRYFARIGILEADDDEAQFSAPHGVTLPPLGPLDWLPPLGLVLLFAL